MSFLSQQARQLLTSTRSYSTSRSPHPALTLLHSFLTPSEQSTLLSASLKLLSSPAQTNSSSRRQLRTFLKSHPSLSPSSLLPDEAYSFQPRHFDGVIDHYRETLVRPSHFPSDSPDLASILSRFYALIPPPPSSPVLPPSADPPPHVLLHLLHLASNGAIYPHVDNREASGGIIVGLSLKSSRVMRFAPVEGGEGEPFEVLLEPGSAYIQRCVFWPVRRRGS